MTKYFKNVKSYDDLKAQYKILLKANHPDNGGDLEVMKLINVEYDALFPIWKNRKEAETGTSVQETAASTRNKFYTEFGWEGSNHDFNRSLKEVAQIVRAYVKEKYPTYKFSVRTSYASMCQELHVELKESPIEIYKTYDELAEDDKYDLIRKMQRNSLFKLTSWNDEELKREFERIWAENGNFYKCLNEITQKVIKDVDGFVRSYNYSDCDGMIDYFDVDFYYFGCAQNNGMDIKVVPKTARISNKASKPEKANKTSKDEGNPAEKALNAPEGRTDVNAYTYEVSEDTDTRTGEKIFLVKVSEKLSREEYIAVNKYIKSLGGYYSKFKHAFLFKENPSEKLNATITEITAQTAEPTQEAKGTKEKPEAKKESISYTIIEDQHTQTHAKIWIVKPEKELNKSDFADVKRKLATLQGYYSSFKRGFIFKYDPTEALQAG